MNDQKSWGSEVIPMSKWIDPTKEYMCKGKRVINLHIELYNSCGDEVTYPVKGNIVVREKPFKTEYCIWSLSGLADVVWGNGDNLVEV